MNTNLIKEKININYVYYRNTMDKTASAKNVLAVFTYLSR